MFPHQFFAIASQYFYLNNSMKTASLLVLALMLNCVSVEAEIVGDNYFGRNLALEFMKLSGWPKEVGFREDKTAALPTMKAFNDYFEFECNKGGTVSLIAQASDHADLLVRYCDASTVNELLDTMGKNLENFHSNDTLLSHLIDQSQISHYKTRVKGEQYDNYHFRAFWIGHGVGVTYFTITTSPTSKLAVISSVNFAKEEKFCLADVFCKFEEDLMEEFNYVALNNEGKFLRPNLNEFRAHLAYPMVMDQWKEMGDLRELVKKSRSFELVSQKYPDIDSEKALQYSDFAGQLNKQNDGTYRMYLVLLIELGNNELSEEVIDDVNSMVLINFDSYMTKFLKSIVTISE